VEGPDDANDDTPEDELTSTAVLNRSRECVEETVGLAVALCERAKAVARASTMLSTTETQKLSMLQGLYRLQTTAAACAAAPTPSW